jgi:tetratricopeptide (TPR) repeat protein
MKKTIVLYLFLASYSFLLAQEPTVAPSDILSIKAATNINSTKNLDLAASYLTEVLNNNPNNFTALLERATIYYEDNKFNRALSDLTRYLEQVPNNMEAIMTRGNTHLQLGNAPEAVIDFTKAIATKPSANLYLQRAIANQMAKQYDFALEDIGQFIQLKPNQPEGFNYKGDLLHALKRYKDAITAYSTSIQLKPNDPITYNNRATTYMKMDESDKAMQDYTTAYQLSPMPSLLVRRAYAALQSEKLEEAFADCEMVLSMDTDIADAYNCMGVIFSRRGNLEAAFAAFEKAIELDASFASAYNNFGLARHNAGEFDVALTLFNAAIRADAQHAEAYTNRGTTKYVLGDTQGAIADQKKCLDLMPDNPYANARLATYLNAGKINMRKKPNEKLLPNDASTGN